MARNGEKRLDVRQNLQLGNQYEEREIIGKGAYGIVYLATHVHTGKEYALKKIVVKITEEGVPQSIIREISALKKLHEIGHPNIVKLHDVFHCSNNDNEMCLSVVYEKCDWDLYEFLRDIPRDMGDFQCRHFAKQAIHKPLSIGLFKAHLRFQIIMGLDFLHSHHVIHRDLKPQNILINRNQTVKIADFGLSRFYSMHSSFTTLVVTLWYRSPEVLLQCSYNSGVDIWAAGCIIAELYSRQPLFPAQTEVQQLETIFQYALTTSLRRSCLSFRKLGTPSVAEWPQHSVVERSSFTTYPRLPFERIVPKLPFDAANLVKVGGNLRFFYPSGFGIIGME
ncbi:unnamed protein product [Enterobius vermicularis]|uniref:cyclin-dependent kinase n=1 Tax=Enterobius vermicularis TaxID=51028 RepID=A0A0N4VI07_ENTVE|nr:unnamed protein product [Enterobius vermicularis]